MSRRLKIVSEPDSQFVGGVAHRLLLDGKPLVSSSELDMAGHALDGAQALLAALTRSEAPTEDPVTLWRTVWPNQEPSGPGENWGRDKPLRGGVWGPDRSTTTEFLALPANQFRHEQGRLRALAQRLIEVVGADGPTNAEEALERLLTRVKGIIGGFVHAVRHVMCVPSSWDAVSPQVQEWLRGWVDEGAALFLGEKETLEKRYARLEGELALIRLQKKNTWTGRTGMTVAKARELRDPLNKREEALMDESIHVEEEIVARMIAERSK